MKTPRTYRALLAVIIGLFASLQVYTSAHAVSFGDAPHEHDGVACVLTIVAADDHIILPTKAITPKRIVARAAPKTQTFTSARYLAPQGRAPPPRGPPTFIQ